VVDGPTAAAGCVAGGLVRAGSSVAAATVWWSAADGWVAVAGAQGPAECEREPDGSVRGVPVGSVPDVPVGDARQAAGAVRGAQHCCQRAWMLVKADSPAWRLVLAGLGGCPAAAADGPAHATRKAALR
jgi:hypothetical protein